MEIKNYPVKSIDKVLQKLINQKTGESLVDFKSSHSWRDWDNTVIHNICLTKGYVSESDTVVINGQTVALIPDLKTTQIWKIIKDGEMDNGLIVETNSNGKPINYNPFLSDEDIRKEEKRREAYRTELKKRIEAKRKKWREEEKSLG